MTAYGQSEDRRMYAAVFLHVADGYEPLVPKRGKVILYIQQSFIQAPHTDGIEHVIGGRVP